jgi:hypothetical protein
MTPERIEEVLTRLPELVIELDSDPTSRGPAYLQDLIYRTRNMLNETGIYIQEVLRWKSGLESELEALGVAFQVDADELLTNEQRVNRLPAVQDRLAMINVILRDQRKAILERTKDVNDAGHVEKAVRHRHRELEHTMSAIRLQRSLIETERKTGSFYGDESETSRGEGTWGRKPPKDDDIDEEELASLMERVTDGEDVEADEADEETPESVEAEPALDMDLFDDDVSLDSDEPLLCCVCGEPQQETESGLVCKNGHGGAPSVATPEEAEEHVEPSAEAEPAVAEIDEDDLPDTAEEAPETLPDEDVAEDPAIEQFLDGEPPGLDDFSDIFEQLENDDSGA